jgi:hypothetical protein
MVSHQLKVKAAVRPMLRRKDDTVSWPGVGLTTMFAAGSVWLCVALIRLLVGTILSLLY